MDFCLHVAPYFMGVLFVYHVLVCVSVHRMCVFVCGVSCACLFLM